MRAGGINMCRRLAATGMSVPPIAGCPHAPAPCHGGPSSARRVPPPAQSKPTSLKNLARSCGFCAHISRNCKNSDCPSPPPAHTPSMIRGTACTIDPPSDPLALIDFDPIEVDAAALAAPDPGFRDVPPWACPDPINYPSDTATPPSATGHPIPIPIAAASLSAPAPDPDPITPPTLVPSESTASPAPQDHPTAIPQPCNTATAPAPDDLPEHIQNQLFEAYLNSDQPATQIAEQAGITLIQFIRWQSHPYTRAIIADLERIASERAATQCTLAQPGAIHSLTLISTQTFDRPETARKAASLLTRLHTANEKRNTTPPPPAPRRNTTPRKTATPQSRDPKTANEKGRLSIKESAYGSVGGIGIGPVGSAGPPERAEKDGEIRGVAGAVAVEVAIGDALATLTEPAEQDRQVSGVDHPV